MMQTLSKTELALLVKKRAYHKAYNDKHRKKINKTKKLWQRKHRAGLIPSKKNDLPNGKCKKCDVSLSDNWDDPGDLLNCGRCYRSLQKSKIII